MLKNRLTVVCAIVFVATITSFILIEKKSFAKGTLGDLKIHVVESNTVKNRIGNSFGGGATSCIEGYSANLQTQNQDTLIGIDVIKKSASTGDCSNHTPMSDIFKKGILPFSKSGSGTLGKFGGLTIMIADKMYSSSLKEQPAGNTFSITAVSPMETTDSDLLMTYKNFYRVDGIVTGRLYNAKVAGDFVDVKGFAFSSVFAERK